MLKYAPAVRQEIGVPVFIGLKLCVVVLKVILFSHNIRVASNKIIRSGLNYLSVWLYINSCVAVVLSTECYRKHLICSDSDCFFLFYIEVCLILWRCSQYREWTPGMSSKESEIQEIFLFSLFSRQAVWFIYLPIEGSQGLIPQRQCDRSVELTTHICLVQRLGMGGSLPPLYPTPTCVTRRQRCWFFTRQSHCIPSV